MALSDLMTNLDQQIREHTEARAALDAGTAALEDMRRLIQQRQADLDTESAKEKSELEDVRSALQAIRDEADRQLASLTTGQGSATTTSAAASTKRAGASVHHGAGRGLRDRGRLVYVAGQCESYCWAHVDGCHQRPHRS
jgi:chromosome segregation ATPase